MTESADLVVRSDRSDVHAARHWIAAGTAVAAVVLAAAVLTGQAVVAVCAAAVGLAGLLLLWVLVTSSGTVVVGHGTVELRRWNGRRVILPLDDDLQGLHARHLSPLGSVSSRPRLVMRHPAVRGRIVLADGFWASADIRRIADAVGVESVTDLMDGRDWQRRAPGLLPWAVRRPYTAIMLGVTAALAVLAVLITLLG